MRSLLFLIITLCIYNITSAQDLKLYIGSAEKQKTQSTRHYIQFVLCNNFLDTVYVNRKDIDNLFPKLTTDIAEATDGGTYYLVNNVINLITDTKRMDEVYVASGKEVFDVTLKREREQYEENNELPQIKEGKDIYYKLAPNKCLTINNLSTIMIKEVLKLHDISDEERQHMQAYYTTNVRYYLSKDKVRRSQVLIARHSDDLKKLLLAGHTQQD